MARISEAELERLRREADLVTLVQARGVELRRHGAELRGRCPLHDDDTLSLTVMPTSGMWRCLGACQTGGTAIEWVMRSQDVSFRHAIELLQRVGSDSRGALALPPLLPSTSAPATEQDDDVLLRLVVDHYHETLKASEEAILFLESRGLNEIALIDRFRLGFANRTLGYRLQQAGSEIRSRLRKLGILRASGHELLRGSLVVPIIGVRGTIVQCYGRKITPHLRAGTAEHVYLPRPHTAVWNLEAVAACREVILCESLLDAMTFWVAGHTNVITSYGVDGFTDAHRAALRLHGTERVLIAYDADAPGDVAAEQVGGQLIRLGIEAYRVRFPRGSAVKDANGYVCAEVGRAAVARDALGMLLRGATWIGRAAASMPGTTLPSPPSNGSGHSAATVASSGIRDSPAASPVPASQAPRLSRVGMSAGLNELTFETAPDCVGASTARTFHVKGIANLKQTESMRVTLLVQLAAGGVTRMHADTLDLYAAQARGRFIEQASHELGVTPDTLKRDIGALLLALEEVVVSRIEAGSTARSVERAAAVDETSGSARAAALTFLRDPALIARVRHDTAAMGVVGDVDNALVVYLAAVSRLLPKPLIVAARSADKSAYAHLLKAVLALVPPENMVDCSSFNGETSPSHGVLVVAETARAQRTMRRLLSVIAPVQRRPAVMLATATGEGGDMLAGALTLPMDGSIRQTRAIQRWQRSQCTLDGLLSKAAAAELRRLHHDAQRLLRPLAIVNPAAPQLPFADGRIRARSDQETYLTLIDSIALLHQYQREVKRVRQGDRTIEYVEVLPADIALANQLLTPLLARELETLPSHTRRCLELLDAWLTAEHRDDRRFTAKEARSVTGAGRTQMKWHLRQLVSHEYLVVRRGEHAGRVTYELHYEAGRPSVGPRPEHDRHPILGSA